MYELGGGYRELLSKEQIIWRSSLVMTVDFGEGWQKK